MYIRVMWKFQEGTSFCLKHGLQNGLQSHLQPNPSGLLNSLFGAPDSTGVGRDADREEPGGEWPGSRPSDQEAGG